MYILLFISAFAIITLLLALYLDHHWLPSKRTFVRKTTFEVLDEILHYNPIIPESEWEKAMLEKFNSIYFSNLPALQEEVTAVLFEHTNLPMAIAFFALYHKIMVKSDYRSAYWYSRGKINKFVKGAEGFTNMDLFGIVSPAMDGVREWRRRLFKPSLEPSLLQKFSDKLQDLIEIDLRISLAPYFNTG
jgi:hypothetical protein